MSVRRGPREARWAVMFGLVVTLVGQAHGEPPEFPCLSGIYPHLATFNDQNECGTGAVVPWADLLWVITYAPHKPFGSDGKLYEIDANLHIAPYTGSVGGTPANRMIHRESNQLIIGPYVIDANRAVRVIPPEAMPGRLTGNARHLVDPANKIYYATMEEGFYEVDVRTLAVAELYPDGNTRKDVAGPLLPGYHGKGLYSGQGRLVYANNGEYSDLAKQRPDIPSGCLAEWDGTAWQVVRRNQFTEVTGPGGLLGNEHPGSDPIWSIGWDHRSLILMLRDSGTWHSFRLPKASHCYDGAHGWNTEWPRIRDIGQDDFLMTMHGMFWRFPPSFSLDNAAGIAPRSTYLKVVGDFCRWQDRIVLGCDDTARAEFLNKRNAKGALAAPGQSQSNLWFVDPGAIDGFGPAAGRGAVWLNDAVKADVPSEAFLFAGFERRAMHLAHSEDTAVDVTVEVDREGTGDWQHLDRLRVPATGYLWQEFSDNETGQWIRLRVNRDVQHLTALFHYTDRDSRDRQAAPLFDGIAKPAATGRLGGLLWARGEDRGTLCVAATSTENDVQCEEGLYELDASLRLKPMADPELGEWMRKNAAIPRDVLAADGASVLYVDDNGRRFRLPLSSSLTDGRVDREVCTERDLFNCGGIFYELPAENAGGFAKIRPIATHNRRIHDYASWRGMLVVTGFDPDYAGGNPHVIRSEDGRCAVWAGAVDDLWQFGKPAGHGGPWMNTPVTAGVPSDPYLMNGFDAKTLTLSHEGPGAVAFRVEVDISGNGDWCPYQTFKVSSNKPTAHRFPGAFHAYWVRLIALRDTVATAQFVYD